MDQRIVVAIGPPLGGKSTFCRLLEQHHGFRTFSFASPLYEMLSVLAGEDAVSRARRSNEKSLALDGLGGKSLRECLQTLGTEWGREMVSETVWIDNLLRRAARAEAYSVDDLRFPNEYAELLRRGAVVVRLAPGAATLSGGGKDVGLTGHASESHQHRFKAHQVIEWSALDDIERAVCEFRHDLHAGTEPAL